MPSSIPNSKIPPSALLKATTSLTISFQSIFLEVIVSNDFLSYKEFSVIMLKTQYAYILTA